jgi:tungstate transport system ATP-binding protein
MNAVLNRRDAVVLLSVKGLKKSYGSKLLLDITQFELNAGDALAITGRNGAGKTTLLRIIAGLEAAEQGLLTRNGEAAHCATLPTHYPQVWRRDILYVHQQPYMLRGTVRSNVAYGLKAWGMSNDEITKRVNAAIAWAQLETLAERDAKTLSGGEKQRVALARAHALSPQVWLLDEPTANLDGASREQVIALIKQLAQSGSTVIVATHDRDLLARASLIRLKLQEGDLLERVGVLSELSTRVEST